jgi:O-antigen ligase
MASVLVIFVVCLIGKDLAFAPFPYALRGAAQALCFAAGSLQLLPMLSVVRFSRYWPTLGYLLVLLATTPFAKFPLFVLLQVLSLASAVIFAIAYFESSRAPRQEGLRKLVLSVVAMYGIVAYGSLLLARAAPNLAYETLFAGDMAGNELRFRGMFSSPGGMGAAAGLLVGLAAIGIKRLPLKLLLSIPGVLCLLLTQSRSFWIAAFVAGVCTAWIYYPRLRKWLLACIGVLMLGGAVAVALNLSLDTSRVNTFARLDSVANLTGRTELWQAAYRGFRDRPWFGYGFTMGGLGLEDDTAVPSDADPTQYSRQTLHNGYIQSVMDAGVIGFFFYLMTLLMAIGRIVRFDSKRRFPEALYVLLFLSIANLGESVVYSGSVFQSLSFWVFAIFALGLSRERSLEDAVDVVATAERAAALSVAPNLMR